MINNLSFLAIHYNLFQKIWCIVFKFLQRKGKTFVPIKMLNQDFYIEVVLLAHIVLALLCKVIFFLSFIKFNYSS